MASEQLPIGLGKIRYNIALRIGEVVLGWLCIDPLILVRIKEGIRRRVNKLLTFIVLPGVI